MFVTMNRLSVHPDHWQAFEERFRQRSRLIDQQPGFIRNMVLRPERSGEPHIVMTFWQDKASFEAWTRSESFRQAHARASDTAKEMFTAPGKLEMFSSVTDTAAS